MCLALRLSSFRCVSNSNGVNSNLDFACVLDLARRVSNSNGVNSNVELHIEKEEGKDEVSNSNRVNSNATSHRLERYKLRFKLQRSKF